MSSKVAEAVSRLSVMDFAPRRTAGTKGAAGPFGSELAATAQKTHKPIAGSDYGIYANVVIDGKVVASLSNSGCCAIANGYGGPAMADALDMPGDGPKLAQKRAEMIAQALGGTVEALPTAQTPEQWAKGGKKQGLIDLWGLDGDEPEDYRPQLATSAMDILLKNQES